MNFQQALKKLNIEEYGPRIFNSNSHGELFHLGDYMAMAEAFENPSWFRLTFKVIIKMAEDKWERPESVFQHIPRILKEIQGGTKS